MSDKMVRGEITIKCRSDEYIESEPIIKNTSTLTWKGSRLKLCLVALFLPVVEALFTVEIGDVKGQAAGG